MAFIARITNVNRTDLTFNFEVLLIEDREEVARRVLNVGYADDIKTSIVEQIRALALEYKKVREVERQVQSLIGLEFEV